MGVAGLVVAIVALSPALASQHLGEESVAQAQEANDLARWSAMKDYIQFRREQLEHGKSSRLCRAFAALPLPPPPHIELPSARKLRNPCTLLLLLLPALNILYQQLQMADSPLDLELGLHEPGFTLISSQSVRSA
ncbi:hypothetical protein Cob_v008547 [Colletotrichum orbiculare MAFF 240422]|uniref:Uncharacterized protein n=1 Tax=Colletotrichum orbiculare (strain 104-T / ATCC 96160 / CBS 514.97 / LARS 414 / MAFF 240422) TaxID=1213857 RepID=A0A484FLD5_COLOR|nr:hypothetical protein Cob_v008547 [Colletotrichum orbiculare MAFF 240422]